MKYVPMSPLDNKPPLIQVMAWRRIGDKPLSEPIMTQFTDAYMRYWGGWVKLMGKLASTSQGKTKQMQVNHFTLCYIPHRPYNIDGFYVIS